MGLNKYNVSLLYYTLNRTDKINNDLKPIILLVKYLKTE